ncbi:hypothetical protein [Arsenophonus apicola]|uniref:Uncharacterized protein n=1 Tax=Arsenophonus apicola TaxID=2879119 RepID=A0ABY8P4Z2_9GAMM|nr:hypothetical protein [Arsenophonus apicola]WGO84292.1 hypothetical protein QG404_05210 [Arsenophonus apicola]
MTLYLQPGFLILSISSILPLFFLATTTASLEEEKNIIALAA